MSAPSSDHPLQNAWAFWEIREGNNKKDYSSNVRLLGEFATIEKFWEFWEDIPSPSKIFSDTQRKVIVDGREIKALCLFKKGVAPEWEHSENADGCQIDIVKSLSAEAMNTHWENLIFGLIGERIDDSENICGVRIVNQNKKGKMNCKLEVWLKRKDVDGANRIKQNLLDALAEGNENLKTSFKIIREDLYQNLR